MFGVSDLCSQMVDDFHHCHTVLHVHERSTDVLKSGAHSRLYVGIPLVTVSVIRYILGHFTHFSAGFCRNIKHE